MKYVEDEKCWDRCFDLLTKRRQLHIINKNRDTMIKSHT